MNHQKKRAEPEKGQNVDKVGHSWDGIEELNTPVPRWWFWTFIATILWALAYMLAYPAIPLLKQATQGLLGYDSRASLEADINHFSMANAPLDSALVSMALDDIKDQPELAYFATAGGSAVFKTFCSQCHGSGAAGARGYPNLLDDDWLWGGSLPEIYHTIRHGINYEGDDDTRFSEMPAFGEILEPDEVTEVTHYVLSISGGDHDLALVGAGKSVFVENCADCHGTEGKGMRELGAPDLTDALWLYGGGRKEIYEAIDEGRKGVMPAWTDRLTEAQLRQVAFFVHQLGGGE